jgi:competence ComEA-like helix-hairpin-helix protein
MGSRGRARTTTGKALPTSVASLVMNLFHSRLRTHLFATPVAVFLYLGPALAQKTPPSQPVNINTAAIEQLKKLPGGGPKTAKSIIDFRSRSGPFQRVEDLLAINGISKSKLEKLRPYVTVGPASPNGHPDGSHQAFLTPIFSSSNFQKAV